MPAPATATPGRLQTQENGEATAAPNGTGPSAPTIEEPAAVAAGTVCSSSMWAGEYSTPGSGVLSLPRRHTVTDVGGHNCASEDPLAVAGCHAIVPCGPGLGVDGASWTTLREATTGRYRI